MIHLSPLLSTKIFGLVWTIVYKKFYCAPVGFLIPYRRGRRFPTQKEVMYVGQAIGKPIEWGARSESIGTKNNPEPVPVTRRRDSRAPCWRRHK